MTFRSGLANRMFDVISNGQLGPRVRLTP